MMLDLLLIQLTAELTTSSYDPSSRTQSKRLIFRPSSESTFLKLQQATIYSSIGRPVDELVDQFVDRSSKILSRSVAVLWSPWFISRLRTIIYILCEGFQWARFIFHCSVLICCSQCIFLAFICLKKFFDLLVHLSLKKILQSQHVTNF